MPAFRAGGAWPFRRVSGRQTAVCGAGCSELLAFLGDSMLVAHNARFDFGFLNHELKLCGKPG
jgi:DNA polymerase-3 subunit epsilon